MSRTPSPILEWRSSRTTTRSTISPLEWLADSAGAGEGNTEDAQRCGCGCEVGSEYPYWRLHAHGRPPLGMAEGSKLGENEMPDSARFRLVRRSPNDALAGFVFVELLMVVAILGILCAIALPAYLDYVYRAKVAESLLFLGDAKLSINEFHSRWGRLPADNNEAGLRSPEELRGQFLRGVSVIDGTMLASMDLGRDQNDQPIERTLTFRPWLNTKAHGSPIVWSCGEDDPDVPDGYHTTGKVAANPVDSKWLPAICRD